MVTETNLPTLQGLPPGAKFVRGQLVRVVIIPGSNIDPKTGQKTGRGKRMYRQVALSLEDARKTGADFYSVEHQSWIRGGRKLESENRLPNTGMGLAGRVLSQGSLPDPDEEEE